MNKVIALLALACLVGCTTTSGGPSPSTTAHSKPAKCGLYRGGYATCAHNCAHEEAMATASAAHCQASTPENPSACAAATGNYGGCMGRCASIPKECK